MTRMTDTDFAYIKERHAAARTNAYVFHQLIPYIGNKRKLLGLIQRAIALAGVQAYVVGFTNSASTVSGGTFPVQPAIPYQDDIAWVGDYGEYDAFVTRLTP